MNKLTFDFERNVHELGVWNGWANIQGSADIASLCIRLGNIIDPKPIL